jgi:hypothetical protein
VEGIAGVGPIHVHFHIVAVLGWGPFENRGLRTEATHGREDDCLSGEHEEGETLRYGEELPTISSHVKEKLREVEQFHPLVEANHQDL